MYPSHCYLLCIYLFPFVSLVAPTYYIYTELAVPRELSISKLASIIQNPSTKILHSKITLFWSYFEENLVPVKVRTKDII